MPIYEYKCQVCEEKFEELVRNPEQEAALRCPSCGKANIQKLISSFAFRSSGDRTSVSSSSSSCSTCSSRSCSTCRI
ncbi:MAG TPA: zinc ribbon domain-containing protein [Candidatus Latescibacteria bacterium]|nr:zinc ribbon domain-containing protein [Candidatus Latescibacterota bacterium]